MKLLILASFQRRQMLQGVVALMFVLCALALPASAASKKKLGADPTLTINVLGSGSVSANPPCCNYSAGQLVTLTANPNSGWSFSSWSGNLTGYANPATIIMNNNYTVTATFDQVGYAGITGDSRTVTEPTFPPVCTTLLAAQTAGSLNQTSFDTTRLQNAINSCAVGQAVELSPSGTKNAFLTQPIIIKAGVTLLIDAEVTLFGSNNLSDYHCTDTDCTHLIQVAPNTGTPGSGIMGYGVIDGQGSFCWDINASGGACPRMIYVGDPATHAHSDNFTLYKTTLQNSTKFHLYALSNGLTVWGAKISTSGAGTNTDGIDPSASSNITIRDSYISDGDDHIALKAGFGPVTNVTIAHNHLYYGHGLSMGSETNGGINNYLATDNVIDQNGCSGCSSSNDIRIKSDISRGGEVKNILYQDTCIRNANTSSHEFVFDPNYDPSASGSLIPFFHDIHIHNVHMVDAGNSSTLTGKDNTRVLTMFMDNVVFDAFNSNDFTSSYTSNAAFTLGSDPVSFASTLIADAPGDSNVHVTNNITGSDPAYDCTGRFVYLAGELFTKTPTVTAGSSVTLTSVLQPAISGAAAPTGTISIVEGATVVASATISGRITYITVPNVSGGTHTYRASYGGNASYAQLYYGNVTVNATGGTPDFSISATPSSQTVTVGSGTSYTVTISPISGFTGTVNLSVSGLPIGTTASFNPTSVAGSGNSTLSVSTSSTTPTGTYTMTITGTSGSLTHSTTVTLVVNAVPTPDFSISATPSSQTVTQGNGTSYTTTVGAIGGFTGTVSLSVSGLPTGATGSFNPTSVATSGNSTLTVSTVSTTPAGTYTLTITGTSGSLTHSATVTLVVNAAVTGDFTIAATPASLTVTEGGVSSGTYTTTVTALNGFTGTVNLSVSGIPSGVTGTFKPTSVVKSGTSTLTVSASSQGKVGTYTLTITGTSGSLTHSTTVTLVVKSEN
jgi:polygalacturonase